MSIKRYLCNLFAFPDNYFQEHTAKELEITEEERKELIKLQKPGTAEDYDKAQEKRLNEFKQSLKK